MGEAFITRSGGSAGGSSGSDSNFITEIFTASTLWKVPENLKDGTVSVRIFGGGSASVNSEGGGGGFMNNDTVNVSNESEVYIHIGRGGIIDNIKSSAGSISTKYGGTTSFGSYLSALGGYGVNGGSGGGAYRPNGGNGYHGYQFGGGGVASNGIASIYPGGNGGRWGGGGGSYTNDYNYLSSGSVGGCIYGNSQNKNQVTGYSGLAGNGGRNYYTNATNGTNTIGEGLEFEGAGLRGTSKQTIDENDRKVFVCGGGGGYGGNGGNAVTYNYNNSCAYACGGGGGYGANGGDGSANRTTDISSSYPSPAGAGGGGGGYGGDGGTAYIYLDNICGGGGGGYGKYGKGGGLHNGVFYRDGGIAAGGCLGNGGDGICIIQYYIK